VGERALWRSLQGFARELHLPSRDDVRGSRRRPNADLLLYSFFRFSSAALFYRVSLLP